MALVDGRRLVTGELSERERAELWAQVVGRFREPHAVRSVVWWLHPVLAVVVELEADRVVRTALPAAES
ncbi:hypothetical protein ACFVSN_01055 [Kitasatospora sp. NPDC057904]|uniref:hypothetical protein n=1 Tax=unclassified Kitasatospora TaxID=2633591 RepID=UPI0036DEE376